MKPARILSVVIISVLMGVCHLFAESNYDDIVSNIFLGQVYPSGHVYLRPFLLNNNSQSSDDNLKNISWPDEVFFQSFSSTAPIANRLRKARFLKVINEPQIEIGPNTYQTESIYIPAVESMDVSNDWANKKGFKSVNPDYKYLGNDFYRMEMCTDLDSNEGTAMYIADSKNKYSYMVVAFGKNLHLSQITLLGGIGRPLSSDEYKTVSNQREQEKKFEMEGNSTTNPNYLDNARSYFDANVERTDLSIRLSQYASPGLYGHSTDIYVLDVMQNNVVMKTYELHKWLGNP